MKKLDTKEFIKRAKTKHGDKYDYSKVNYINNKEKVIIICPEHGEFTQTPDNHISGRGCSACGAKSRGNNRRKSLMKFIEEARAVHGNRYDYSKVVYTTALTKVTIVCPEHGEFTQTPNQHLYGQGCPACGVKAGADKKRSSSMDFIKKAQRIHGDKYDYSKVVYTTTHSKVTIICPEHGEFTQTPAHHLNGQGCSACGIKTRANKKRKPLTEFIEEAMDKHEGKYDYSQVEYTSALEKVTIICPEHGPFEQTPDNHLHDHGCRKCVAGKNTSFAEGELVEFLSEFTEVITNDRGLIGGKELDIVLPKFKIAIEYNGIYYHSDKFVPQGYHLEKTTLCSEVGYRLIHIFEDEWLQKKDIVKSRLRSILGSSEKKIYARKTSVGVVSSKEAMLFLNENHIQGAVGGSIYLGLYSGDKLVSLMTFCKTRAIMGGDGKSYELQRFCSLLNYNVVGGAGKLLKHFEKHYSPTKVISYADRRWSEGGLYFSLGFQHTHNSQPNYFYVIGSTRKNRYTFRKSILVNQGFNPELTEREIMQSRGIPRVYDCGAMVFHKIYTPGP